jgi:hypothetical protein
MSGKLRQRTHTKRLPGKDKELMRQARSLYHSIYVVECFGTGDLCRYEVLVRELEQRGYRMTIAVAFDKEE